VNEATGDSKPSNYRDLIVWQHAINLTDLVYRASRDFPREEMFGLTSQLRRASVSVAANIAEGSGRRGTNEYLYHLGIARGSLHEVTTMVVIADRQSMISSDHAMEIEDRANEVGRMLSGLIRSLEGRIRSRQQSTPEAIL
jgi:four helix bundle protein